MISVMMVSIVMVITGLGLIVLGIIPGLEEIWRIMIYLVISIIYISFWLGVSILFSILFRSTATSALAALAVWIFFSFFISLGASVLANALDAQPAGDDPQVVMRRASIVKAFVLTSPMELYREATATIIDPTRKSTPRSMPELSYRGTLYHYADRHNCRLFCHFLHRVYAAGNPVTIKPGKLVRLNAEGKKNSIA
jgi:ABC-2 type transport system permease protein